MYRTVCRGPPAGQERPSYVEFKREAAGEGQGRPRRRKAGPATASARGTDGP